MNSLVRRLLEQGFSLDDLRNTLLKEAGHRFTPGSCASVVYGFYQAVQSYYAYYLGHEFQLYSDRPKQFFNIVDVFVKGEDFNFNHSFTAGNDNSLNCLSDLNEYKPEQLSTIRFDFVLAPNLKDLTASIENDRYKDLFKQSHTFYVPKGDGTFYEGVFEPKWSDGGLSVTLTSFNYTGNKGTDLMRTYGYT